MNKKEFFRKPERSDIVALFGYIFMILVILTFIEPIQQEFDMRLLEVQIQDYDEIGELTAELVSGCPDSSCQFERVEEFVENIPYKHDNFFEQFLELNNDPLFTLEYGNDCDGKAVLAIDMMKSIGKDKLYLVAQPNHVCWGHFKYGKIELYNCNYGNDILYIKRVV